MPAIWLSRRYHVAPEPVSRLVKEAWAVGAKAGLAKGFRGYSGSFTGIIWDEAMLDKLIAKERSGIADEAGEISDEEDDGVAHVLKVLELADEHGVSDVEVGGGGVEPGLDAHGLARRERALDALAQVALAKDPRRGIGARQRQGLIGGDPGGSCGISRPDPRPGRVALGSPFQLKPSFSGTYCWSLSHSSTVGALFAGLLSHGMLRTPRTLSDESCGIRQYSSPDCRSTGSMSDGTRICRTGRYPVVHGGGRLRFRLKLRYAPL